MREAATREGAGDSGIIADRPGSENAVFALLYERGPAWVEGSDVPEQPGIADHREYLRAHAERIVANGPLVFQAADRIVGLLVLQARDLPEAERFIAEDPGIRSGVFRAMARQWRLRRFTALDVATPAES